MNTNLKVAAVVVTYNRIGYLKDCISAIRNQTYKNFDIIVVNNGSTDGTKEWLLSQSDLIIINQVNCGGAGGFYAGMKYMFDNDYDAIWMMDDDGLPDSCQLMQLVNISQKYNIDLANAFVVNRFYHTKDCGGGIYNPEVYKGVDFIPDKISPFNGTFIMRHVLAKIGLIKKEMFIWGDEREYTARVRFAGYKMGTIPSAIHYHPPFKGEEKNILPFIDKWKVAIKPAPRDKIYFRNIGYIDETYHTKNGIKYIAFYLSRLKIKKFFYFLKFYRMGLNNDYSKQLNNNE